MYVTNSLSLSGQYYLNFVGSIRTDETKKQYVYALKRFMLAVGESDLERLVAQPPKLIEAHLIDWIVNLREEEKLSRSVINLYLSAVLKFYLMNDVLLNRKKISSYLGDTDHKFDDRAYTHQEISKLISEADERMKVVILLLASAGVRIGALPEICLRSLEKIEEYNIYKIVVYERTKERYITFCTPECAQAIDSYLQYRERFGERLSPDSPLLRQHFHHDQIISIKRPRKLSTKSLPNRLGELLIRCGLVEVKHETTDRMSRGRERKEVRRSNGFRKFADTMMIKAKVDAIAKELMLGHDLGLDKNYWRPGEEDLLNEYLKAVDFLTINNEHRLQRQVAELTQKKDEIQVMKEEHEKEMKAMREEMNQQFSQIMSMVQENPKLARIKPEALAEKIKY
jgi:integrase